ncbi:hypothetical protein [Krasilnikovia sp. MM14-A1259]|uniref:hypothetical protein n=1 Tax=Krasilnikovia sp. MM14-A1259 TaxID=3373539 RepID=UPI00381E7FF2
MTVREADAGWETVADDRQVGGCRCCLTGPESAPATDTEHARGSAGDVRARLVAGATRLGIGGAELAELEALAERGDCAAVRRRTAHIVDGLLAAAELRVVEQIEHAARAGGNGPGDAASTADQQRAVTELTAQVARLQAAAHRLAETQAPSLVEPQAALPRAAEPPGQGACDEACPCATVGAAEITPRIPASRAALTGDSDLVCTIAGGAEAMHARVGEWQAVLATATGREPAAGGVTLTFAYDPAVTVELARLAAAEYACCSFFTFGITVGPPGVRFTVAARPDAADVVAALFGSAGATTPRRAD